MTAGLNLTALHRARDAMDKRRAEGKPAPRVLFVEAALGYDTVPVGGLAKAPPAAGAESIERLRATSRARAQRQSGAAVTPGRRPKEDSRFAYQRGNNYIDRQCPPEREIGEVEG